MLAPQRERLSAECKSKTDRGERSRPMTASSRTPKHRNESGLPGRLSAVPTWTALPLRQGRSPRVDVQVCEGHGCHRGTARDPAGSRARLVQSRATLPDFVPRCRRSWQKPLSLRTMETPHHATLALRLPLDQGRKTRFFSFGKEILTRPPVLCLRGCCFRGDAVPPRLLFLRPLLPFSQLSPTRVLTVEQAATSLGGL